MDTMTAPALDALAGLLEKFKRASDAFAKAEGDIDNDPEGALLDVVLEFDETREAFLAAAVNALPALLATARRERRLREALEYYAYAVDSEGNDDGGTARAALAEEGQDVE